MQSLLFNLFLGLCVQGAITKRMIHSQNKWILEIAWRTQAIYTYAGLGCISWCVHSKWLDDACKTTVGHQTQRTTLTHNSYILDTNMNLHMGITWETHTFPGLGCFWTCGSISLDPSSPQWNMFYSLRKCIRQWLCTWSHTSKISRPHARMYCPGY